jgi:hypothetical protein
MRRVESGELFRGIEFREHLQTINVQTEWLRWLAVSEGYETGRTVNFNPPVGIAPSPADFRTASLTLTVRPTSQFRLELTYLNNQLRGVATGSGQTPGVVFDNHVARATANYQFTRALSARAILDYRAILPDTARVALSRDKQFVPDLLVTNLVQPGTAVYVGYTSASDNQKRAIDTFERLAGPTNVRARQLFVKTSYLLRF